MTFRPTKKRQAEWVQTYLNGGVCPTTEEKYRHCRTYTTACYAALEWLSEAPVYSLADAWDLAPQPSWLLWMLDTMAPDNADYDRAVTLLKYVAKLQTHLDAEQRNKMQAELTSFQYVDVAYAHDWLYDIEDTTLTDFNKKLLRRIRQLWPNPWRA